MMELISKNIKDLTNIANTIISKFPEERIFLFEGNLGSGKTTLIKEIIKQLSSDDEAISPTFAILNVYQSQEHGELYHFDLYRIKDEEELLEIGFEDYVLSGNYCFIEWPQIVEDYFDSYVKITITTNNNTRTYKIEEK
jgi:tRNA threonylcarbamoyladenosine biosynthesis protein TsaE